MHLCKELKNRKKNVIAVVMNGNSIVSTTTEVLTLCFCSVFGEKLSDIIKSLDKEKYITLQQ